jgi:dihydrodipicolinate synthase/N-acetylneuraminate lyase
MKEAMNLIGLPAGSCRRPVKPMPAQARDKLISILEQLREERYLPGLPVVSARKQAGT